MPANYEEIIRLIESRQLHEARALLDDCLECGSSYELLWASNFLAYVFKKNIPYTAIDFEDLENRGNGGEFVLANLPTADLRFALRIGKDETAQVLRAELLSRAIETMDSASAEGLQAQVDLGTLYLKTGDPMSARSLLQKVEPFWKESIGVSEFILLFAPPISKVSEIFEFWEERWKFNGTNYLNYLRGLEFKFTISKRLDAIYLLKGFSDKPTNLLEASKIAAIYAHQENFELALESLYSFFDLNNMSHNEHWIEVYSLSKLGHKSKALDAFKSIRLNDEYPSWFIIFYFQWMIINVKPEGEALRNATQRIYRFLIYDPDNAQLLRLLRIYLFSSKKFKLLFKRSKALMEDPFFVKG